MVSSLGLYWDRHTERRVASRAARQAQFPIEYGGIAPLTPLEAKVGPADEAIEDLVDAEPFPADPPSHLADRALAARLRHVDEQ